MAPASDDPTQPGFTPDAREALRTHFLNKPTAEHAGHWDALWQKQVVPWDRKFPNPALVDLLNDKTSIVGQPVSRDGKRKRALVPGCGRGYDVLLLASYGYDAYGLDASKTALEACKKLEKEEGEVQYSAKDADQGKGRTKFLFGDFFGDDWFQDADGGHFDFIYDYTFLCALPPQLRPAWAKRQSELLTSDGRLVCLEFPTSKPPSTGGPPFGLSSSLYVELFKFPGQDVEYDEDGYVVPKQSSSDLASNALVRAAHWKPERTHAVGQGSDWVSIWHHKV